MEFFLSILDAVLTPGLTTCDVNYACDCLDGLLCKVNKGLCTGPDPSAPQLTQDNLVIPYIMYLNDATESCVSSK